MNVKSRLIYIPVDEDQIQGDLNISDNSTAIVLFAHGSGSSRHSPRNRYVAGVLREAGRAPLLLGLLTGEEETLDERAGPLPVDIALLGQGTGERRGGEEGKIWGGPQP